MERQVCLKLYSMLMFEQRDWNETYADNSVTTPPRIIPNAPPTGAPAEKVAKAKERALDGGNAWANIPI